MDLVDIDEESSSEQQKRDALARLRANEKEEAAQEERLLAALQEKIEREIILLVDLDTAKAAFKRLAAETSGQPSPLPAAEGTPGGSAGAQGSEDGSAESSWLGGYSAAPFLSSEELLSTVPRLWASAASDAGAGLAGRAEATRLTRAVNLFAAHLAQEPRANDPVAAAAEVPGGGAPSEPDGRPEGALRAEALETAARIKADLKLCPALKEGEGGQAPVWLPGLVAWGAECDPVKFAAAPCGDTAGSASQCEVTSLGSMVEQVDLGDARALGRAELKAVSELAALFGSSGPAWSALCDPLLGGRDAPCGAPTGGLVICRVLEWQSWGVFNRGGRWSGLREDLPHPLASLAPPPPEQQPARAIQGASFGAAGRASSSSSSFPLGLPLGLPREAGGAALSPTPLAAVPSSSSSPPAAASPRMGFLAQAAGSVLRGLGPLFTDSSAQRAINAPPNLITQAAQAAGDEAGLAPPPMLPGGSNAPNSASSLEDPCWAAPHWAWMGPWRVDPEALCPAEASLQASIASGRWRYADESKKGVALLAAGGGLPTQGRGLPGRPARMLRCRVWCRPLCLRAVPDRNGHLCLPPPLPPAVEAEWTGRLGLRFELAAAAAAKAQLVEEVEQLRAVRREMEDAELAACVAAATQARLGAEAAVVENQMRAVEEQERAWRNERALREKFEGSRGGNATKSAAQRPKEQGRQAKTTSLFGFGLINSKSIVDLG